MKKIAILLFFFFLGFASKGLLSYFGVRFASYPSISKLLSSAPYGRVEELNAIANNRSMPPQRRAEAVYGLFAHHISCGMTASEVNAILGPAAWVSESSVTVQAVFGGTVPIDPWGVSVVIVQLFDKQPEFGLWKIYLGLKGNGDAVHARDFLEGRITNQKFTTINEFALTFPHPYQPSEAGRTERYSRWQVRVKGRDP